MATASICFRTLQTRVRRRRWWAQWFRGTVRGAVVAVCAARAASRWWALLRGGGLLNLYATRMLILFVYSLSCHSSEATRGAFLTIGMLYSITSPPETAIYFYQHDALKSNKYRFVCIFLCFYPRFFLCAHGRRSQSSVPSGKTGGYQARGYAEIIIAAQGEEVKYSLWEGHGGAWREPQGTARSRRGPPSGFLVASTRCCRRTAPPKIRERVRP